MPPYLAGRDQELSEFRRLLDQRTILENLVLTGLRGVGKTVLLDTFKPRAIEAGWLWAGADLSEAASISEQSLSIRLLTDLSVVTSGFEIERLLAHGAGFRPARREKLTVNYQFLNSVFEREPGLVSDKLKAVLGFVASVLQPTAVRGIIFAYDEAQNMSDHAEAKQYPLSLLLDVFQSMQRKGAPFMLVLTGLPTLFPKLVEARTYSERMFRVVFLKRLEDADCRDAILKPIADARCPIRPYEPSVKLIIKQSGGYPCFVQFICREVYDAFVQKLTADERPRVPMDEIVRKLDTDFFAGRWARATDRQRELLWVISELKAADDEFTVQEIVERSKRLLARGFSPSHVNQMLATLSQAGLVYKNRHGRYSFAVPLLGQYIKRQMGSAGVGKKRGT